MTLETALAIGIALAVVIAVVVEWRRDRAGALDASGPFRGPQGGADGLPPSG